MIGIGELCRSCHKGVIMEYKTGIRCSNPNCKIEYTIQEPGRGNLYPNRTLTLTERILNPILTFKFRQEYIIFITLVITYTLLSIYIGMLLSPGVIG